MDTRDLYQLADKYLPSDIAADLGLASTAEPFFMRLRDQIALIQAERDRFLAWIEEHGDHGAECRCFGVKMGEGDDVSCTCGLTEILYPPREPGRKVG